MPIHKTVLLKEAIEALNLKPGMIVVDATLGGGGHSFKIIEKIGDSGMLIAIDQDIQAIKSFAETKESKNIYLVNDNFANLKNILADLKIEKVDAILADLGISSDQLEDAKRGISFRNDSALDMRMDMTKGITAAEILNTYTEKELEKILKYLADEKYARSIARNIVIRRKEKPINWTLELVEIIGHSVPDIYKRKKIHYATKTFQALRIEVNRELESLDSFLSQAIEALKSQGRLAIITFHSGEDSLVKYAFRENARGCICPPEFPVCQCHIKPIARLVNHKPIAPSYSEIKINNRARSAKLRVIEKI